MADSVRPHRRQPTRLPCPWDSPGKNTGVGCHFLLQCMKVKVKLLSHVVTPWTVAYQAPLPMGFSRQEYWSGLPLPSPKAVLFPVFQGISTLFSIVAVLVCIPTNSTLPNFRLDIVSINHLLYPFDTATIWITIILC